MKPDSGKLSVRAFLCSKKVAEASAEDSGVSYADHTANFGDVTPPLMLFPSFS